MAYIDKLVVRDASATGKKRNRRKPIAMPKLVNFGARVGAGEPLASPRLETGETLPTEEEAVKTPGKIAEETKIPEPVPMPAEEPTAKPDLTDAIPDPVTSSPGNEFNPPETKQMPTSGELSPVVATTPNPEFSRHYNAEKAAALTRIA
jgi:hypothetical protein